MSSKYKIIGNFRLTLVIFSFVGVMLGTYCVMVAGLYHGWFVRAVTSQEGFSALLGAVISGCVAVFAVGLNDYIATKKKTVQDINDQIATLSILHADLSALHERYQEIAGKHIVKSRGRIIGLFEIGDTYFEVYHSTLQQLGKVENSWVRRKTQGAYQKLKFTVDSLRIHTDVTERAEEEFIKIKDLPEMSGQRVSSEARLERLTDLSITSSNGLRQFHKILVADLVDTLNSLENEMSSLREKI